MSIPNLLNRTNYSFLNSALTVEDIVNYAVKNRHTHVVVSDFESAHSWPKFHKIAKAKGLIPVIGLQINYQNSSLLFLAKNKEGYGELVKLSTHKNPLLISFENLIFIHLEGEDYFENVSKYIANKEQPNGVYVRESKFKFNDFEFYCALRAISNNSTINEEKRLNESFSDDYLEFEIDSSFRDSFQIKNISSILGQCSFYEILEKQNTLSFHENPLDTLKSLLKKNLDQIQFANLIIRNKYETRIYQELEIVAEKGFCEYFLIVYDAVKWAKENSIYVGPGRGSVCGSLMAYVLGITEVDPIKYELYFERFLNPTRTTIPDIDIDVASNKREELFNYLKKKYGENHVSLIAVYRNYKARNSIRDVCRVYGVAEEAVNLCLKSLSHSKDELNIGDPSIVRLLKNYPEIRDVLVKIQDYPSNLSLHAAGVIISSVSLKNLIPMMEGSYQLFSSQWTADELKEMNFVKFDFLALQYLQVLGNMENRMSKIRGAHIVWKYVDLNDEKVYETIINGRTTFIFQFEGLRIKKLIQNFRPSSLLDLALISSIHRPGASDQIPTLLARKCFHSAGEVRPDKHEGLMVTSKSSSGPLSRILRDTYGLLVYQEQLMKIVSEVTLCSFGEADIFRRGLSESPEKEHLARQWFFSNSSNRFSKEELESLWDSIAKFAKYGFNKSHAVAYALISYRLMWIKAYYPDVFYFELLSISLNSSCFFEMEEVGFSISGPTYGKSSYSTISIRKKVFYLPLVQISGIGITEDQYSKISFKPTGTLEALQEMMSVGVSVESLRILIRVGYFNVLFNSPSESELFWEKNLQSVYDNFVYIKDGKPIFDLILEDADVSAEDKARYVEYQRDLLGIDLKKLRISNKFFEQYKTFNKLNRIISQTSNPSKYIGILSYVKESRTFKDVPFLWLILSDGFYTAPNVAFFGKEPNFEVLKEASKQQLPVIVDIEKSEDYYKAIKVKIIK